MKNIILIIVTILITFSFTSCSKYELGIDKPNFDISGGWDSIQKSDTTWMHQFYVVIKIDDDVKFDDLGVDCDETTLDMCINKYHYESYYHYGFQKRDYDEINNVYTTPLLDSYTIRPYIVINGKKIYGETKIFNKNNSI